MKFLRSTILTLSTNILLMFTAVITTVVTSRALGTDGKGVLAVSTNILSFSTIIFGLGFTASNVYFVGEDKDNTRKITTINAVLSSLSVIILVPLYFINLKYNIQIFNGVNNFILIIVLVTIPFMTLKTSLVNVILGMQEIGEYNKVNLTDKVLTLLMLIAAVLLNRDPASVIISNLVSIIIVLIFAFYKINKKTKGSYSFDIKLLKRMLAYGIKAQIGNLVQLLNYRVNIFIINYYLTIDQVGIYSNAVALGETLWQVSGSIATVIFPMTTGSKNKEEMKDFINKVTRISFSLIIICSILLSLISEKVIVILFGQDFIKASEALLYLLPGISIFSISNILANYMAGVAKVQYNIYSSAISFAITMIFNILLVPRLGIDGAAIATSLSYVAFTISAVCFYKHITKSKVKDILLIKREDISSMVGFIKNRFFKKKTVGE